MHFLQNKTSTANEFLQFTKIRAHLNFTTFNTIIFLKYTFLKMK